MYRYSIIKEKLYTPESGNYISYGICVYLISENKNTEIAHISDVFLEKEDAVNFINLFNQLELDPVHLDDAIENILISPHTF